MQQLERSAMLNRTHSRILAVSALAGLLLVATAAPASATTSYYPSGPQTNVPLSTVTAGGWTLCWDERFDLESNIPDIIAGTDDHSLTPCNSEHLLITGWATGAPATLVLLAAAPGADIFAETPVNRGTGVGGAHLSNGTWWVFSPGYSMGFGPNSDLSQTPGEHARYDGTDPMRMSWHMFADDEVSRTTLLRSGWSIGDHVNAETDYHRAIFAEPVPPVTPLLSNTGMSVNESTGLAALALVVGAAVLVARRLLLRRLRRHSTNES